jgi:hypothetical protein
MRTSKSFLLAVILTLGIGSQTVAAQDATPEILGAAQCTVDPIDPDAYIAAVAAATPAPPLPSVPQGTPADAATVAAVTDTMRQSVACTNAGDLGRLLALIDPSYAPTLLGVPNDAIPAAVQAAADSSAAVAVDATPLVDDLDNTLLTSRIISISDVMVLPQEFYGGLVSLKIVIERPDIAMVTATVYLREDAGRYIITNYVYDMTFVATPTS